jgi:hypothetical protein
MVVETYECEEVAEATPEQSEEAIALIAELGLEGQEELVARKGKHDSRLSPYRLMTIDEIFVYSQICPAHTPLNKFKAEPIPLRVLQVASHAREHFKGLEVWSREGAEVKDPVLVGWTGDSWNKTYSILARWGEALDEWPAVVNAAMKLWREHSKANLEHIAKRVRDDLEAIGAMALSVAVKRQRTPSYDF